jgi:hypothetical protein
MLRLGAIILLFGYLGSSVAHADSIWTQTGKSGRFMFNLKLGPAFAAYDDLAPGGNATGCSVATPAACDQGTLGVTGTIMFDFGFAVTPDKNGYLLFPIQFQVAKAGSFVMIPVGFQYDIPLPVKGLYLTPRISLGYAAYVIRGHRVADLGFITPEFGVKYVIARRWNVGVDPFSLPIFFGDFTAVSYRLLIYGGVNF